MKPTKQQYSKGMRCSSTRRYPRQTTRDKRQLPCTNSCRCTCNKAFKYKDSSHDSEVMEFFRRNYGKQGKCEEPKTEVPPTPNKPPTCPSTTPQPKPKPPCPESNPTPAAEPTPATTPSATCPSSKPAKPAKSCKSRKPSKTSKTCKTRKPRKASTSCPKKPTPHSTNPFIIFFLTLHYKCPKKPVTYIACEAGKMWCSMTREQKQIYKQMAKNEQKRRKAKAYRAKLKKKRNLVKQKCKKCTTKKKNKCGS